MVKSTVTFIIININKYTSLLGFGGTLSFLNGKQDRPHIHCSHTAFAKGRIIERGRSGGHLLKKGLQKEVQVVVF